MQARTSSRRGTARGARVLAVLAVLLCGFAILAPLIGHVASTHPQRIHVIKVVNAPGSDQQASALRVDHPAAVLHHVHTSADGQAPAARAVRFTALDRTAVDTVRTRGPPTAAA